MSEVLWGVSYESWEEKNFSLLWNTYYQKIYDYIMSIIHDSFYAEDLLQDVAIKIFNAFKKGKYQEQKKFLSWALRIAHNVCVDYLDSSHYKNLSTYEIIDTLHAWWDMMIPPLSGEQLLIKEDKQKRARQFIDRISDDQARAVVILRYYVDMSYKEIANTLNINKQYVGVILHRFHNKLQQTIWATQKNLLRQL